MTFTKELVTQDLPLTRLREFGSNALSDAELLSLLIGKSSTTTDLEFANSVLQAFDRDLSALRRASMFELVGTGLTYRQASCIMAALQLSKRTTVREAPVKISSSGDIYQHVKHMMDLSVEEFHVIYLNRGNRIINKKHLSTGGVTGTVVDSRVILKDAILIQACSIVLIHNHPSGNLKPSEQDIQLTRKLREAARLIDAQLLDHLIIAEDGYYSFADEGTL